MEQWHDSLVWLIQPYLAGCLAQRIMPIEDNLYVPYALKEPLKSCPKVLPFQSGPNAAKISPLIVTSSNHKAVGANHYLFFGE